MPKGLLIKGTKTIIRYDERYANEDRFELIEDVAEFLAPKKEKPKRTRKPRIKPESVKTDSDAELDTLLAGIENGKENNR